MTPDTSAEAVERRARELDDQGDNGCAADAALLRALLRERDELAADIASALRTVTAETEARAKAEAERDEASRQLGEAFIALDKEQSRAAEVRDGE